MSWDTEGGGSSSSEGKTILFIHLKETGKQRTSLQSCTLPGTLKFKSCSSRHVTGADVREATKQQQQSYPRLQLQPEHNDRERECVPPVVKKEAIRSFETLVSSTESQLR